MASAWRVPPVAPVLVPHTCVGEPKLLHHPVRKRSEARFCTGEMGPVHGSCEGAAQEEEPSSYKWRLLLSYDGTKYAGWQLQQKPVTVQLMLQEALTRITKLSKKTTLLVGASRTDTGVHALGQVAHFYTTFQLQELQSFHDSLNGVLPSDIRIREVAAVQQQFHARHLAKKKTYQYKVYCDPIMDPFQLRYALHVRQSLNINAMREAAKCFVGEHDFIAFANASKQVIKGGFVREIYRFEVTEKDSSLLFEVEGSGFFNKQVRNMVGLLLEIGKEVLPSSAACIILASRCRKLLANYASSAPPHGLYLMRVVYDEADLESPPGSPHNSCGIMQTRSKCKVFLPQLLH